MSAYAIETQKKDWVQFFERLLNWAAVILSGFTLLYINKGRIGEISDIAEETVMNSSYVGLTMLSGGALAVAYGLYAAAFIYPCWVSENLYHDKKYSFFPSFFNTDRIWIFAVLAVISVPCMFIASMVFEKENSMLGTPYGYVHLMENGIVLQSGVTVQHNPKQVGSVPVSLYHDMHTNYVVKNETGYAKYMTVVVNIRLDGDNEAFKEMLAKQDRSSLGWGEGDSLRASSQRVFFMKVMTPLLEPSVTQVFQEIAEGKLQGGNNIVMLRLGDVFNKMVGKSTVLVPSWIQTINVTKVEVTGWQQS